MTYAYRVYGLTVKVPFPCPLLFVAPMGARPDVTVHYGHVPQRLAVPVAEGPSWQAEPGRFLWLGGPHSARFLAEGGEVIAVELNPDAKGEMLVLHFLDSVLAAVLGQRGLLVLHASAAITAAGAVAVSGESGAGKSTTLAALMTRGCAMLSDDITVLRLASGGGLEVLPGIPQLHLTEDAAEGLGQDITDLPRFRWRRMKAAVPAHLDMAASAAPLRALHVLHRAAGQSAERSVDFAAAQRAQAGNEVAARRSGDVEVEPLVGARKFAALMDCVYGPLFPEEHIRQFSLFAALTERIPVYHLQRPAGRWTADEVAAAILDVEEACRRGD